MVKISIYLQTIGVDTAENEPEALIWNNNDICAPYFQPNSVLIRFEYLYDPIILRWKYCENNVKEKNSQHTLNNKLNISN